MGKVRLSHSMERVLRAAGDAWSRPSAGWPTCEALEARKLVELRIAGNGYAKEVRLTDAGREWLGLPPITKSGS